MALEQPASHNFLPLEDAQNGPLPESNMLQLADRRSQVPKPKIARQFEFDTQQVCHPGLEVRLAKFARNPSIVIYY